MYELSNLWLFYALGAMFSSGILSFIGKISAEKKHDSGVVNFYAFISHTLTLFIAFLVLGKFNFPPFLLILAVIISVVTYYTYKTRVEGLKYISSTTFFVNYRILSSVFILIIGVLYFRETLRLQDLIGFLIGFVVFILLIEKNKDDSLKSNFKKGLYYLLISAICISIMQFAMKYVIINKWDAFFYISIVSSLSLLFSYYRNREKLTRRKLFNNNNDIVLFGFLQGLFMTSAAVFIIFAYELGKLAIVYKIVSFAVLIPIILSVIIYKEKITIKKFIAITLAMVSIWLFIWLLFKSF